MAGLEKGCWILISASEFTLQYVLLMFQKKLWPHTAVSCLRTAPRVHVAAPSTLELAPGLEAGTGLLGQGAPGPSVLRLCLRKGYTRLQGAT